MGQIQFEEFMSQEDKKEISSFSFEGDEFHQCGKSRKTLNKALETNYQAVFRKKNDIRHSDWKGEDIELSGEEFFVVTASGRVLRFWNSEWGGVGLAK